MQQSTEWKTGAREYVLPGGTAEPFTTCRSNHPLAFSASCTAFELRAFAHELSPSGEPPFLACSCLITYPLTTPFRKGYPLISQAGLVPSDMHHQSALFVPYITCLPLTAPCSGPGSPADIGLTEGFCCCCCCFQVDQESLMIHVLAHSPRPSSVLSSLA